VARYRATVEVGEDGRIWVYFGSAGGLEVGFELPRYKYLSRIRDNVLRAIETARRLGCLEEVEE